MSISTLTTDLKELLADGKVGEALEILTDHLTENERFKELQDDVVMLRSRYSRLRADHHRGLLSNAEFGLETNRILQALIATINTIDRGIQGKEPGFLSKDRRKIIILFLSANTSGSLYLRLDKEMQKIEEALLKSTHRDKFEFIKYSAVRISDLQDTILKYSPDFVHLSGHGHMDGLALLDSQSDRQQLVLSQPLAALFKLFPDTVDCVFLNSCYSAGTGMLIRRSVPHVIGMTGKVPDNIAIEFAAAFYKGIGAGKDISFSFELAKNSIDLHGLGGADIPVLL